MQMQMYRHLLTDTDMIVKGSTAAKQVFMINKIQNKTINPKNSSPDSSWQWLNVEHNYQAFIDLYDTGVWQKNVQVKKNPSRCLR